MILKLPAAGHEHIHPAPNPVAVARDLGELGAGRVLHPPVGHDHTLIAPFLPGDGLHQIVVVVAPDAVDPVVAGHQGQGLCLLQADLKALEINFPQGTLRNHGIASVPVQLLIVAGKMLDAGTDPLGLETLDHRPRNPAGEIGILGKILEIPAAQGIPVDVHAGRQQHVAAPPAHFRSHCPVEALHQLQIEGAGKERAHGKQRTGIVQPDARRAVGGGHGADTLIPEGLGHAAKHTGVAPGTQRRIHIVGSPADGLQFGQTQLGHKVFQAGFSFLHVRKLDSLISGLGNSLGQMIQDPLPQIDSAGRGLPADRGAVLVGPDREGFLRGAGFAQAAQHPKFGDHVVPDKLGIPDVFAAVEAVGTLLEHITGFVAGNAAVIVGRQLILCDGKRQALALPGA